MKGLLLKEFEVIKSMKIYIMVLGLLYIVLCFFKGPMWASVLLLFSIPVSVPEMDEKVKWDTYGLTLPVSRKQIVQCRYLMPLCFAGVAVPFMLLADGLVLALFYNEFNTLVFVLRWLGSVLLPLMLYGIEMTIYTKFGKSLSSTVFTIMFSMILYSAAGFMTGFVRYNEALLNMFSGINCFVLVLGITLTAVVIYYISMMISIKIYEAKSF